MESQDLLVQTDRTAKGNIITSRAVNMGLCFLGNNPAFICNSPLPSGLPVTFAALEVENYWCRFLRNWISLSLGHESFQGKVL